MPEHNPDSSVEQLLKRAEEPPRIDPKARARILDRLRERDLTREHRPLTTQLADDDAKLNAEPSASEGQSASQNADPNAGRIVNTIMDKSADPNTDKTATWEADEHAAKSAHNDPPGADSNRRRWSPVGLGLAFAACLALLWGIPRLMRTPNANAPGDSIARHHNDGARPQAITLTDGSVAWLRSGATLEVLEARRVHLEGEALLRVVDNRDPFTVETQHGNAIARGEVLFKVGSKSTVIAVARGHARLVGDAKAELRSGETVTLRGAETPTIRAARRLTHLLAWAQPLYKDTTSASGPARRGNLLARDPAVMAWTTHEWPLPMRKLDVDVVIENGVARTTIDQTFYNPTYRTLEGVYSFPLPSGAAISRLAMYVDGTLMEGGIVERQRGREIYESIVYRRRDPALLEQMAGNEFRIRVFPLPGHQEKRLFLSYVEPLAGLYGAETLRVPLPELDQAVASVNVKIHLHDGDGWTLRSSSHALEVKDHGTDITATWHDEQVVLGDDLLIQLSPRGESDRSQDSNQNSSQDPNQDPDTKGHNGRGASVNAVRDGDRWLLRVRPAFDVTRRAQARRFVVLYDTSASRDAGEIAAQERLLGHLLRSIDSDDRLAVLAFDTTVRDFGPLRPIREIDAHALRAWTGREGGAHVGATDLAAALRSARTILDQGAREGEAAVILYLGDGLVSGETQGPEDLAEIIGESAIFVAAALGDPIDTPLLSTIADATGGLVTEIDASEELAWRARELIATIATPRMIDIQATLLGSEGQILKGAPVDASARSLSEGEDLLLTTTSSSPPASVEIRATIDGQALQQRLPVPAADSDATYVSTLWARARIAALLDKADHEDRRKEITDLALEHFLVTPYTSLLVVESEAMAKRYKLRRPTPGWAPYDAPPTIKVQRESAGSLGDIRRGTYVHRSPLHLLYDPYEYYETNYDNWGLQEQGRVVGRRFGIGGLGLIGTGTGGGGGGFGSSLSGKSKSLLSNLPVQIDETKISAAAQDPLLGLGGSTGASNDLFDNDRSFKRMRRSAGARRAAGGERFGGRGYWGSSSVSGPTPSAWHYPGDPRLDDLTSFIPGLFETSIDRQHEHLLATHARAGAGSISEAARTMIDRARAHAPSGGFVELGQGDRIWVDNNGTIERRHSIGDNLEEQVIFDGANLLSRYPDLDLEVHRDLRSAELLAYGAWAPWMLPSADSLAKLFDIKVTGEGQLQLRRPDAPGLDSLVIELHFDNNGRLISRQTGDGSDSDRQRTSVTQITYSDNGLVVERDGQTRTFERHDEARQGPRTPVSVTVEVPYKSLKDAEESLAKATTDPSKRRAADQRLATLLALDRIHDLPAAITERLEYGPLSRGELVLASAGIRGLKKSTWARINAELKTQSAEPVAAYIRAIRDRGRAFAAVSREHTGTLPGLFASYRDLLTQIDRRPSKSTITALQGFIDTYDQPSLAYILTWKLNNRWSWQRADIVASAWQQLAQTYPQWRGFALHSAAVARYNRGDMAAASEYFLAALKTNEDGSMSAPPQIDWIARQSITSQHGQATWDLHWNRWRDYVERSHDPEHLLAFVNAALRLSDHDALHRVLARVDLSRLNRNTALTLVNSLQNAGLTTEARPLLRHLRSIAPDDADVLLATATLAEALGDLDQAATALEQAIANPTVVELGEVRQLYRRAFELRARLSQADLDGKPDTKAIDAALAVASRWRIEDPDNAFIDELTAGLLYSHQLPARAWRQLSSIAERHPHEGEAHARVAKRLAHEGDLEAALRSLDTAILVEPTNPTWLLQRAQILIAANEPTRAKADLKTIAAGDWQDRFSAVLYQAKTLNSYLRRTPAPGEN